MAVLDLFLEGVTAEILINGALAQEHEDIDEIQVKHASRVVAEYQEKRTVSKYIQSQTGQEFTIKFTVGPPHVKGKNMDQTKLGFHVYVDGNFAGKVWCEKVFFKKNEAGTVWTEEMKGIKVGKGAKCAIRNFAFTAINPSK